MAVFLNLDDEFHCITVGASFEKMDASLQIVLKMEVGVWNQATGPGKSGKSVS